MSSPHRWSRHILPDAPQDAHRPGYWTAGPSGYESPRGAPGRSSLAYTYRTSETTTWTISSDKTVDYMLRSKTTRRRKWSAYSNWSSTAPKMEHGGSIRMEEPGAPRNRDHRYIGDGSYPTVRESRSPAYSRPRSSDRTYWRGSYNSKASRSQGHRSHSYSSGEDSDHKSSKHSCDKNSRRTKFESGHRRSGSHYSDDQKRRNGYEPGAKIRSRRRDGDYGRSNKHDPGRTSNQNRHNSDSGRSRKYEPDYKTGSRHRNEDNSRSDRYKAEPRYERARPRILSTIEGEKEELPNYYATLGISSFASYAEIKKAAKLKRVEVHPDKCIKPDMSESEKAKAYEIAAAVGQAADVLTDGNLRIEYDKKVARKWTL